MVGIPIKIEYDDAWEGLKKNLMCRCSPWGSTDGEYRAILNVGDTAAVAHEVMLPDMYLYLGVEGYSDDGKLVMPTTWATCGRIAYGASTCEDPSTDPELSIWNQLQVEMEQTKEYVLTPEQAVNIQACAQEARQAAEEAKQAVANGLFYMPVVSQPTDNTLIFEFQPSLTGVSAPTPVTVELPSGGSGDYADMYIGPDEPAGDDRPLYWLDTGSAESCDAVYTIVNRLSNATTDNAAAEIDSGSSYRATLTAADGYVLASVVVMMGGVNVTSAVYSGGVISIPAVTGNVRIAVTTTASGGGTVIHTITNKLTNVSSDNGAVSVEAGAAYTANLTAADGYTMTGAAVTVLMGGEDVTGTAYASGVVSIAAVTGDLEITAAAAKKNDLFDEANVYKSNAANTGLEITKDELDAIDAEKLYYLVNLNDQYRKKMTMTARFTPAYGSTTILDAIGIAAANDGTYAFITAGYDCYTSDGYVVFEIDIPALRSHIQGMIDDCTLDLTKGVQIKINSYNVPADYMHYLLYHFAA